MEQLLEYQNLISALLLIVVLVSIVSLAFIGGKKITSLIAQMASYDSEIDLLKRQCKQHHELLNELKMVTRGISQKLTQLDAKPPPEDIATQSEVTALKAQLQQFEIKLQGLESQDPTSRLYTKASKLVASGASVEEIMQECDLPRAEAELVMSLHAKK